jgi:hypothetical protein
VSIQELHPTADGEVDYTWIETVVSTTDISAATIKVGVGSESDPLVSSWVAATPPAVLLTRPNVYTVTVQLLVGTGGMALAAGEYWLWVQITAGSLVVERKLRRFIVH